MQDYLWFRRHLTPDYLQYAFWFGLLVIALCGLSDLFGGAFWNGVLTLLAGPVILRVACELVLAVFRISDQLDQLVLLNSKAPPVAPASPIDLSPMP